MCYVSKMSQQQPENLRHAYRALLGDAYESQLTNDITLSSAAGVYGADFGSAWTWLCATVQGVMEDMPVHSYGPMLVTDKGAAWIPLEIHHGSWFKVDGCLSQRIARFVAEVQASHVLYTYAMSTQRQYESFFLLGTDGHRARRAHWGVVHGRRGKREIRPLREVQRKNYTTYEQMPPGSDPTEELETEPDGFLLSVAASELRELRRGT